MGQTVFPKHQISHEAVIPNIPDFRYNESTLLHNYRVKISDKFVVFEISYKAPDGSMKMER
jgi:hypothetical protein